MKMKKKKEAKQINNRDKYKLFSYFMDHIPDVIYFKNEKGRLILVNQAHAKGLGLKPGDVVGKTDFDLFSRERAELMTKDDTYVMTSGKPIIDKVERATRADGIDNYVSTTKIPRYDNKGKIIGLVGITRDITRRIRSKYLKEQKAHIEKRLEALEQLNRLKSEFISTVSHELRTPLAIIKQLVMLMYNETVGPINSKQKEVLKKSQNNIERLKNIIDELLDISRIEREEFKLRYSLVNLNDLIRDSSDFFKKLAKDRGINLEYRLPRKQANIFIDAERINRVFSNLIDNAIKFTEEKGKVKVEVRILEDKVRVGVIDSGIGIAKANLSQLFNKFTQVSKIATAERKGVGLGLSIAKELIERHRGEIWVESKSGVGSKFYFTLPRFYETDVLDNRIKSRINDSLDKDISVYFINLLIVNYKEFKDRIKVVPGKLFEDLEAIVGSVFKRAYRPKFENPPIVLSDNRNGKCSIVFSEEKEKKAAEAFDLLKDRVRKYFIKNRADGVFIAFGILPYPHKAQPPATKHFPANIRIKRICIGLEKRRFRRILYEADVKIFLPNDKAESSQTVDISEGGICFLSEKPLETNSEVSINLELPRGKKAVHIQGRVAWRKKLERLPGETTDKYKVGLEFTKPQKLNIKRIFPKEKIKEEKK